MAITRFRPQIWSALLLASLKKTLVYAGPSVVNRDYEGEISQQGDVVKITSISRPTIGTYVPNSTVISPEELTDAQRNLIIDQAKYFAFKVDDVDQAQARGNVMPEAMEEVGFGFADVADQYVAGLYTGAQSANVIGTTAITTGALAYTNLVALGTKLSEASVPMARRYAVIPPWYHGLLQDNINFINAEKSGTTDPLLNGFIGRAAGFDLLVSNNVPIITGDDYAVTAGVPGAISYAEQINKTEAYRPEASFSDAVKGLHLYGAKLVRPDAIAVLTASKT